MTEPAFAGTCFRCGQHGHHADSTACPWLAKAASRADHDKRIGSLRDRYTEFRITIWQKTRYIKDENRLWYDGQVPSRIT